MFIFQFLKEPVKSNNDDYCNSVTWYPSREGHCWKKTARCKLVKPVSEYLERYPDMTGAMSAYKHYSHQNNFSQYSQFSLNFVDSGGESIFMEPKG